MDSQSSNASSTDCPIATETTDVMESLPDRITFSSDVHPEQKHNYLTNKYNTDNGSDEHGGISLIQGFKTKDQMKRRIQVLPHILVRIYFDFSNVFINYFSFLDCCV